MCFNAPLEYIFTLSLFVLIMEFMNNDSILFEKFGRNVEPGKIIFKEGEIGEKMFIIQRGKVRITKSIAGKSHILAVLEKGDFFGEMAIVNQVKRTATVIAIDRVNLLVFDRNGFLNMVTKNAKIALNIIDKLCRRLQNANLQINHLVRKNGRGLIALCLSYAFRSTATTDAPIQYDRTVEEISLNLEFPTDSIELIFEELINDGIVSLEGNHLKLLDEEKLNIIAESLGKRTV